MSEGRAERIEIVVDAGAAAALAAAVAYCCLALFPGVPIAVAAAGIALACALLLLRAVHPEARMFGIGEFAPVQAPAWNEATDANEDEEEGDEEDGGSDPAFELLLDDVLAPLPLDSRVVRLFDRTAIPTPGELRARIDRHLGSNRVSAAPPQAVQVDASQALHEALAELRRSLR